VNHKHINEKTAFRVAEPAVADMQDRHLHEKETAEKTRKILLENPPGFLIVKS